MADRFVELAGLGERVGEVVTGLSVIRLQVDGILELADRLVPLAFFKEAEAKIVVRRGEARQELRRRAHISAASAFGDQFNCDR